MRKSVMIGFGLWLLAVGSVAAIAWLAIDTAARPVTALSVTAASPSVSALPALPAAPASPISSRPAPDPTTPVTTPPTTTAQTPSRTRPSTAAGQESASQVYFGAVSTEGGRVRAQCLNQRATLDGGYARPEPGWMVHVDSGYARVRVVFGSQARVIAVMAQCTGDRPTFSQWSGSRSEGAPFPDPSQTVQSVSPPVTSPGVRPQPLLQQARTATTASTTATTPTTQPDAGVSPSTDPTGPVAPAAPGDAAAPAAPDDAARVAAYVTAQDQMCAPSAQSSEPSSASAWCERWNALPMAERYELVWRWLHWMERDRTDSSGAGW